MVRQICTPPAHFPEHPPYSLADIYESDMLHKPPHIPALDSPPMLLSGNTPSYK